MSALSSAIATSLIEHAAVPLPLAEDANALKSRRLRGLIDVGIGVRSKVKSSAHWRSAYTVPTAEAMNLEKERRM